MTKHRLFVALLTAGLIAVASAAASGQEKAKQKKAKGGLMSGGNRVGNALYLSGAGSRDPKTGKHPEGMAAATRQAMLNLKRNLDANGFTFDDVVATQVWLKDLKTFQEMNGAYRSFFHGTLPTRTTIEVTDLPGGSNVEIAMVAVKGPRKAIYPEGVAKSDRPYSPGLLVGDTLYVSGLAGVDPKTGKLIEGDIKAHVTQTLKNVGAILKAADMDFSNVVLAHVYLTNPDDFGPMNEVYRTFTKAPRPARVPLGASTIPLGSPVEITVVASRNPGKPVLPEGMQPSENYSRGLLVGNTFYLAGVGSAKGTVQEQVDDGVGRVQQILRAAGWDLRDVVEANVYLSDLKDYEPMNKAYRRHFSERPPARSTVAVSRLPAGVKIMLRFIAARPEKGSKD